MRECFVVIVVVAGDDKEVGDMPTGFRRHNKIYCCNSYTMAWAPTLGLLLLVRNRSLLFLRVFFLLSTPLPSTT